MNHLEIAGARLIKYIDKNGKFNYEKYKNCQNSANKTKIKNVWVVEENIEFLSKYIKDKISSPNFGICHGTRRGSEQAWFRKYLNCDVIGTEIADSANSFPNTIQWDFHDIKPEWINSVDFIYSNSFDHSYDPEKALDSWMSCLKNNGICIIEFGSSSKPTLVNNTDPFGCDIVAFPFLVTMWGKGKYGVREILEAPKHKEALSYLHFIVIQKFYGGELDSSGRMES